MIISKLSKPQKIGAAFLTVVLAFMLIYAASIDVRRFICFKFNYGPARICYKVCTDPGEVIIKPDFGHGMDHQGALCNDIESVGQRSFMEKIGFPIQEKTKIISFPAE